MRSKHAPFVLFVLPLVTPSQTIGKIRAVMSSDKFAAMIFTRGHFKRCLFYRKRTGQSGEERKGDTVREMVRESVCVRALWWREIKKE